MADAATRASDAFLDDDFEAAEDLFTQAIAADPKSAELYANRAQTRLKLENFIEAVEDASNALDLNPRLSKAHLRKGVALFNLEEYESAKASFEAAHVLEARRETSTWIRKCDAELQDEAGATPAASTTTRASMPAPALTPAPAPAPATPGNGPAGAVQPAQPAEAAEDAATPLGPAAPEAAAAKYRHQYFQTATVMEVAVLAKNLTPERTRVDIQPRHLRIAILSPEGEPEYELDLDLAGEVVPAESRHELLKTKVEVRLRKATPATWPALEAASGASPVATNFSDPALAHPPAYPSSSARPKKNWDKLEHAIKVEEKDEKLEGEAALQKLFRDIYSGADEDTRRAMNKSFQESNGTVLSTNWKEIGAKKIECTPPEGMEVKTYGK
ncbi:hypothetical protein WJX81_007655 [Elliptochloris bilobata]|uniref:Suppressor of G2 allele of SKP1 n=1 Tax=Elliptochloris bilobata TaxID=381761 RepID=A0AAW1QWD8_9CHLO